MNKKHFYAAVILLLLLAAGIQPALAIDIPTDTSVGTWDGHTYKLTKDVSEGLVIGQSNMILDGDGHTVTPIWPDEGVDFYQKSGITIMNLNVTGGGAGISLRSSNGCTVTNNTVSECDYGIWIAGSSNNTVTGNTVESGPSSNAGIWLQSDSDENTLTSNTVTGDSITGGIGIYIYLCIDNTLSSNTVSNYEYGIKLSHSYSNITEGNTLTTNNISNNYWGIHLYCSNYNSLTGNNVTDNDGGIWLDTSCYENNLTNNTVLRNGPGIYLRISSNSNTVIGNTASDNDTGFLLSDSSENTLEYNTASNNEYGIKLIGSSSNILTNNTVSSNTLYGIWLDPSNNNQIYNNNFIANATHAEVAAGSGNLFNLDPPTGGNYWSGWTGPAPYVFTGGQDEYPWAVKDGWLDTTPPIISCPGNTAIVGPDGVPVDDERIQTFLNGASATDNCDPEPIITNDAPAVFPPGDTVVTFTATDASGNSSSCSSTVTVVDTEGHLRIIPSIINREGRLEKILAVIRFPEGTTEEDIDIDQPLILYPGDSLNGIEAINQRIVTWYRWGTLRVSVFASFSKDEVTAGVPDGPVEMMVIGRFDDSADGEYFYGFDTVWIISWDW